MAAVAGLATGLVTFAGLMIWFGRPFIPSSDELPNILREPPQATAAAVVQPTGPTDPGEQVFQTCAACHQANAQGLPGAFPPLAGSEWVGADPQTPIRVVLMGLSGPVTVKGGQFNSMMPPPPGMDDDKIALVLTYVRSHFGNSAGAVTKDQVVAVRNSLAGRNKPFSAEELSSLRPAGGAKPATPTAANGGNAPNAM
ncbi:MAG TPA: cytochrome c, partial [Polyangiales bacterium]